MEGIGWLAYYGVLAALLVLVHASRRGNLEAYARQMSLTVPEGRREELVGLFARRKRVTLRGGMTGLALGLLLAVGALLLTGSLAWMLPAVIWPTMLGVSLATRTAVVELAPSRPADGTPADGARLARLVDLTAEDFSTRWERAMVWLAPAMLVLSLGVPVVVWLVAPGVAAGDVLVIATATFGLIALGVWFMLRRAEHRLVAEPEAARDEQDLAWLDALRASAVRDLRGTAGSVAIMASGFALAAAVWMLIRVPPVATADPALTRTLLIGVAVACAVLWIPMIALELLGRRTRNPAVRLRVGGAG